jgi:DNA-binding HxlR family transcriptional regulator
MKKYPVRCPVTAYLNVMDGHWKPIIVWYIRSKPLRFKELQEAIPDISTKVLSEQLKELEEDKILLRKTFNEIPPRVEYRLTHYGKSLLPALTVLREWGLKHLKMNKQILHPQSEWNRKLKITQPLK